MVPLRTTVEPALEELLLETEELLVLETEEEEEVLPPPLLLLPQPDIASSVATAVLRVIAAMFLVNAMFNSDKFKIM